MDKKIIVGIIVILILVAGGLLLTRSTEEPAVEDKSMAMNEAREIAEDWIMNDASTYVFDGFDLAMEDEEELVKEETFSFVFSFKSRMAGYGDRTDEISAQVITPHTMQIIVERGSVTEAVTDGAYDEIKKEIMEETFPETMNIKLYFVQIFDGQEEIVEVERSIPYTIAPARAAMQELLKGPLPHEEGMSSAINKGTELQNISIQDGTAFVDFSERLEEGVAGSALVMAIRNQIEKTLMQFDTVEEVIILINGRTEDILQP